MYKEKLLKAINNASSELTAGHVTSDEVDFFCDILEWGGFTIVKLDLLEKTKLTRELQQQYFSLRKGAGRYPGKEAKIVLDESKSVEIELDELLKEWDDENGFGDANLGRVEEINNETQKNIIIIAIRCGGLSARKPNTKHQS